MGGLGAGQGSSGHTRQQKSALIPPTGHVVLSRPSSSEPQLLLCELELLFYKVVDSFK